MFTLGGRRTPSAIPESRPRLYLSLYFSLSLDSLFLHRRYVPRCSFLARFPPPRSFSLSLSPRLFFSLSHSLLFLSLKSTISRSYNASSLLFSKQERGVSFMRNDRSFYGSRSAPTSRMMNCIPSISMKQTLIKTSRNDGFSY